MVGFMRSVALALCVAALLSLSCSAGPADEQIVAQIDEQLANSPVLGGAVIDVTSRDGVVTLSGVVASEEQRTHAESVAWGVEGVQTVESRLEVASRAPAPAPDVAAPPAAPQAPM